MPQQNIILKILQAIIFFSKIIWLLPNLAVATNYERYMYKCEVNGKIIGYYDKPCAYIPEIAKLDKFEEVIIRATVDYPDKKTLKSITKNHQDPASKQQDCSCDLNAKRCVAVTAKIFLLNKIIRDLNKDLKSQHSEYSQFARQNSNKSQKLIINKLKKYLTKYNLLKIKYCKR
jgi:hypothetical protein